MIRVLIADDHPLVRAGLKDILGQTHDIAVVSEAASAPEVLEKAGTMVDVVVLDISMPGSGEFDTLAQLRRQYPKLPVLVLSMHSEEQYGVRVLRAGASGYLRKDTAPGQLIEAVRKVAVGSKYVSARLAEQLADGLATPPRALHDLLSDREYAVLCWIGRGQSIGEIALQMGLSVKTVSTYRCRLLQKMRLTNNAEAIRYVVDHRLLEDGAGDIHPSALLNTHSATN
jgi:two-component system, NarL family, invasion response regulator UvrY